MTTAQLLKLALPLVQTHGFTREALSRSVLSLPVAHAEPLGDMAVSALFGSGDEARRTLISAWLEDSIGEMKNVPSPTVRRVLQARLARNEPVLEYLPEAFALLATPQAGVHLVDPFPALKHATNIADEACYVANDTSLRLSWFARRLPLAAIYAATELHQMTSPTTASAFLDSLLDTSSSLKSGLDDVTLFSSYVFKSWSGILKSKGYL